MSLICIEIRALFVNFWLEWVPPEPLGVPLAHYMLEGCIFDEILGSQGSLEAFLGHPLSALFPHFLLRFQGVLDMSAFVGNWAAIWRLKGLKL